MTLTPQDRIDITDLINLHGHRTDAGDPAGLYTDDVVYDVTDLGGGTLHGPAAIEAAGRALGDANPVGHHVTNIVITDADTDSARVRAKGIGVLADGTAGSVTYDDLVVRTPDGWRLSRRTVSARRVPGPRDVLVRWRQAAIDQSADELRRLYAADAVHEFPFTRPGLPSRLTGRDEIVDWIAAGWENGPLTYAGYRTTAVHDTTAPDTIVVEQEAVGTSTTTGDFALPNLLVLTVRGGQIVHLRDYVNIPAAVAAIGS